MESQAQAPKLLDQARNVLRLHHYSIHTERSYIDWIKRYVHFQQTRIGTATDLEMRCSKAQHKCLVRNKICSEPLHGVLSR